MSISSEIFNGPPPSPLTPTRHFKGALLSIPQSCIKHVNLGDMLTTAYASSRIPMKIQIIWDESTEAGDAASACRSVHLPSWPVPWLLQAAVSSKTLDVVGSNFRPAVLARYDGRKQISSSTELNLWDCCILCLRCEAEAVGSRTSPGCQFPGEKLCWCYFSKQNKTLVWCRCFSLTRLFSVHFHVKKTQSFIHYEEITTGTTHGCSIWRYTLSGRQKMSFNMKLYHSHTLLQYFRIPLRCILQAMVICQPRSSVANMVLFLLKLATFQLLLATFFLVKATSNKSSYLSLS